MEQDSKLLTLYSNIQPKTVKWLWYPYIPIGKITLLQGDPGDGKSTMMMNLISEVSIGGAMPDGTAMGRPRRVIYQCSEDGAKDTIRPRLEACGADCRNIAFLDEEVHSGLTLDDERIRDAIIEFKPWLVVIDPVQSYIESDADLMMAAKARKLMKRIGLWAATFDCAIVLIGHLNKSEGSKGIYRGLGSIDVVAAARSILQVERSHLDPDMRIVKQIKNNLAPTGKDISFEIKSDTGFKWLVGEAKNDTPPEESHVIEDLPKNKHELATIVIRKLLENGEAESSVIRETLSSYQIGEKTMNEVKAVLGIKSVRRMRKWYWRLPGEAEKNDGK